MSPQLTGKQNNAPRFEITSPGLRTVGGREQSSQSLLSDCRACEFSIKQQKLSFNTRMLISSLIEISLHTISSLNI